MSYACRALAEYLEIIKGLVQSHPTTTLRYLLQNPNIHARSGLDVIEVFGCSQLRPSNYRLMPMNDTCTQYVPIEFKFINQSQTAYLNTTTNIIRLSSPEVSCPVVSNLPVKLDNVLRLYNLSTGITHIVDSIAELDLGIITVNETSLEIPELIFKSASIIDWEDLYHQHSLNDIFSSVTKQKRVLKAMGIRWNGDPRADARENIESIFEQGFFSFIMGGHVGSPWEIYVFGVCSWVTFWTFVCCIRQCCIIKQRGLRTTVASIKAKVIKKPEDTETLNNNDESTSVQPRTKIVHAMNCTPIELEEIEREVAPPAYPPLYPKLPRFDEVNATGGIIHVPIKLNGQSYYAL